MSDFYLRYYDLMEDQNSQALLKCIVYNKDDPNEPNLISTKENVEKLIDENDQIIKVSRVKFLRYLYFVWLDGIQNGPAEWWCEMWPTIKNLVVISTCMESYSKHETLCHNKVMEIPPVLLKLWDYIKTQQNNNNWSYVMDEYYELCKKHNDIRELYFI